mmetsp:Transcript_35146/g.88796  ORF Transcript_35146/g.88796 Transcript_35146/m.88796 type:complete len:366 (-) Transcript_35146:7-1104(-)
MLDFRLRCHQGCDCGRARLQDLEAFFTLFCELRHALVLMTPDHELNDVRNRINRERVLGPSIRPVLMDHQYVEVILVIVRDFPFDLLILEGLCKPLVPDVAQAVQRNLDVALAQQQGPDDDVGDVCLLAKVVEEARRRQYVERRVLPRPARVVVVAVDDEDGHRDVDVGVLVVDNLLLLVLRVAHRRHVERLHHALAAAAAVLPEEVHRLDQALARRLIVVEEVSPKEQDVGPVGRGDAEDLLEGDEGVVAAHDVPLEVAEVVVCGNYDPELVLSLRARRGGLVGSRHRAPVAGQKRACGMGLGGVQPVPLPYPAASAPGSGARQTQALSNPSWGPSEVLWPVLDPPPSRSDRHPASESSESAPS